MFNRFAGNKKCMNKKQRQIARVLIVDDELVLCQFLKQVLRQVGFVSIDIAVTGRQANQWLESKEYELIFLDINLPEVNGLNLLEDIRYTHSLSKVVMCSADSQPDNVIGSRLMGAVGFLEKPFSANEVVSFLGNHKL